MSKFLHLNHSHISAKFEKETVFSNKFHWFPILKLLRSKFALSLFAVSFRKDILFLKSVTLLLLGSYYMYWSYHTYYLNFLGKFSLICTVRWHFLLGKKLNKWKFSLIFQIYLPYDLKNQACNIYKYRNYNRNLRIFILNFASHFLDSLPYLCCLYIIWNRSA